MSLKHEPLPEWGNLIGKTPTNEVSNVCEVMNCDPSRYSTAGMSVLPKTRQRGNHSFPLQLLIVAVMSCCSTGSEKPGGGVDAGNRRPSDLRIGTYNLYVGSRDLPQTIDVIKRMNADVIALQEVSPDNAKSLNTAFSSEYPYRYFSSAMGLLSRFPLRNPHFERSQRGINGFIFAGIEHPQGRIQIANMHLDPLRLWTVRDLLMLPFQYSRNRRIQRDELLQAFSHLEPSLPTILMGDFNRVSDEVIGKLHEQGFADSFATVTKNPDRVGTLHFSFLGLHFGRRIDFVFHDRRFRTVISQVVQGRPSDHDALVSILEWNSYAQAPRTLLSNRNGTNRAGRSAATTSR